MKEYGILAYAAPAVVGLIALVVVRISLYRLRATNRRRALTALGNGQLDPLISRNEAIAALASLRRPGDFSKAAE
jgi:hypothetical protein